MAKLEEKDFKSPCERRGFTKIWDSFVEDLKDRPNFKKSHLIQLRVLVDLVQEYDKLTEIILEEGYSYSQEGGRYGNQEKTNPNVSQRNRVIDQIKTYSIMLGLTPMKSPVKTEKPSEDEVW